MLQQNNQFDETCQFLQSLSNFPEQILEINETLSNRIKSHLKHLYDYSKAQEFKTVKSNALSELITQDFDTEQIWQQLELQNVSVLKKAISNLAYLTLPKKQLPVENSESSSDEEKNVQVSDEDDKLEHVQKDNEDEIVDSQSEIEMADGDEEKMFHKKSIVDDEFFKLHEMEQFLLSEEKKNSPDSGNEHDSEESDKDSEGSIDLFVEDSENSDDGNARLAKYKEFFVAKEELKKEKRNKFLEEFSDAEEQPSALKLRQERLQKKIEDIENRAVSEKPWQLLGEIKAGDRPHNSLLEEIVEFDRTSRPAPVITGETTLELEDIIKQRIKDKVFDSVVRKVKPVETPLEYKKQLVLDQEKSKASLAQIYEKEYLDQQAALDPDNKDKDEEEPEAHKQIRNIMTDLYYQLDSLSNFHYTPKPAIPELKIISNVAAINMEEVAPVAVSDVALLAPEEIKPKPRTEILGKSERTATDKKRERRKKKLKQKYHSQEKAKRENRNLKSSKIKGSEGVTLSDKKIKSSTAFFTQLQEQIQSQIKTKNQPKRKNQKVHDARKIKL